MSNKSALLEIETGVTPYDMQAITDSGDATVFTTPVDLFSELDGYAADIKPNGVLTGSDVSPAVSAANDAVDISLGSVYLAGALTAIAAGVDKLITRPATDVAKINSITVTSAGAIAVVAGTDGATSTFSAVRGAAGGPPYIPVGSVELAQVKVASSTSAPITAAEIFAVPNVNRERAFYPTFKKDNFTGTVTFSAALMLSHTGDLPKGVYASFAEPQFIEQEYGNDFVPAETSQSVTSVNTYTGPKASASASLNQSSFTAILEDGITDPILSVANQKAFVRFYQDKNKTAYILEQGYIGVSRAFNVDSEPTVTVTVSCDVAAVSRAA